MFNGVLGDGPTTLETDKPSYPLGGTVTFSGSGYDLSTTYGINVSYVEDGLLVESLDSFTPTEAEGVIPTGVSWVIPFDAKDGDYIAEAYTLPVPGTVVASATFTVLTAAESLEDLEGNMTDLKELIVSEVDAVGISDSLLASLSNAIKKVESAIALFEGDSSSKTAANQLRAARNMLTAFVHKVLAQMGKGIDDEDLAEELTGKALEYIRYIDSLIGSTLEPLGKKLASNVEKTLHKQEEHLVRFMIRKGLDEATTDEDLLSLLNSMEEELSGALERAKGKMKILEDLLASGAISESDFDALLMELEKGGDSVNLVKAMAELLSEEIEGLEQERPGLGVHLGQLKHQWQ